MAKHNTSQQQPSKTTNYQQSLVSKLTADLAERLKKDIAPLKEIVDKSDSMVNVWVVKLKSDNTPANRDGLETALRALNQAKVTLNEKIVGFFREHVDPGLNRVEVAKLLTEARNTQIVSQSINYQFVERDY
jgi:hypothetical protein